MLCRMLGQDTILCGTCSDWLKSWLKLSNLIENGRDGEGKRARKGTLLGEIAMVSAINNMDVYDLAAKDWIFFVLFFFLHVVKAKKNK